MGGVLKKVWTKFLVYNNYYYNNDLPYKYPLIYKLSLSFIHARLFFARTVVRAGGEATVLKWVDFTRSVTLKRINISWLGMASVCVDHNRLLLIKTLNCSDYNDFVCR